jgi:anti-anti-sigma factor
MSPDSGHVSSVEAAVAAFEMAPVVALVLEGEDLRIAAANSAARRLSGRRWLVGRPCAEAIPEAAAAGLLALAHRVRQRGEPFAAHEWRVDLGEGTQQAERYLDVHRSPWAGPSGAVRGVVVAAVDTTAGVRDRRQADEHRHEVGRRYAELRDVSNTLQDTLLPDGLPVLPGVQSAGSYLVAEDELAAGGDWLDVVPRGDGRVAFVVGDVVGHGVEASAAMGQLRAVCEERLTAGEDLADVLASLDRYAARQPAAEAATVVVLDLDPATGEFAYCTAGHPPPLVLHEDETHFLAPTGAAPLGTSGRLDIATGVLGPDELVLLYTDGIIERPGRRPTRATVELAQVAGRAARPAAGGERADPSVDRVCRQTMQDLTRDTGYSDDITLLIGRRVAPVRELQFEAQATTDTLRQVRTRLADWFDLLQPTLLDQMALQHAIGEAVTNVVEHAYGDDQGDRPVCVSLSLDDEGMAVARIEDRGRWRLGADPGTGARGLPMVSGLMDEMYIERGDDHTTVTLRHRLSRDLSMMRGVSTRPHETWSDYVGVQESGVLFVSGVIDLATSEKLRRDLLNLVVQSIGRAAVDLSGVELLASAGVQVLYDARTQARRQGVDLRFTVAQGSVAQHVLHLVGLDADLAASEVPYDALPPL